MIFLLIVILVLAFVYGYIGLRLIPTFVRTTSKRILLWGITLILAFLPLCPGVLRFNGIENGWVDFLSWAGYIDMTPDLLPVLDRLDQPSGLVLATGFSGHGFGLGPAVGKVVSELVVDGKPSLDLHALRFARFADGTRLQANTVV